MRCPTRDGSGDVSELSYDRNTYERVVDLKEPWSLVEVPSRERDRHEKEKDLMDWMHEFSQE